MPVSPRTRLSPPAVLLAACLSLLSARATAAGAAPVRLLPPGAVPCGELRAGTVFQAVYTLQNTGTVPLTIVRVRAGCPCAATADYPTTPLAPGATAQVTVKVFSKGLPEGPFERTAMVEFADGWNPLPLVFAGTVVKDISILPSRDLLLPFAKSPTDRWEQRVQIRGNLPAGDRLVLGRAEPTAGIETDLRRRSATLYELTIRPRLPMALGAFRQEVTLPILEPAGMPLEVIRLRGEVGYQLMAVPVMLDVPPGTTVYERTVRVSFRFPSGERLDPAQLTVDAPPGVSAACAPHDRGAMVTLRFAPEARRSGNKGSITLRTPLSGPLELPFYVLEPPAPAR